MTAAPGPDTATQDGQFTGCTHTSLCVQHAGSSSVRFMAPLAQPSDQGPGSTGEHTLAGAGGELPSADKAAFLSRFGASYGYGDGGIDSLRRAEFPSLVGKAYVDHAGSTLYAASQLQQVFQVVAWCIVRSSSINCRHTI